MLVQALLWTGRVVCLTAARMIFWQHRHCESMLWNVNYLNVEFNTDFSSHEILLTHWGQDEGVNQSSVKENLGFRPYSFPCLFVRWTLYIVLIEMSQCSFQKQESFRQCPENVCCQQIYQAFTYIKHVMSVARQSILGISNKTSFTSFTFTI